MAQTNDDERAERLKAALRDNLRRRKDQSRARGETDKAAERAEPDPKPDTETSSSSFGHEKP